MRRSKNFWVVFKPELPPRDVAAHEARASRLQAFIGLKSRRYRELNAWRSSHVQEIPWKSYKNCCSPLSLFS